MSCTGSSVRGFSEFDDLCRGLQGYSTNLAQLFDTCDIVKSHHHSISFKEALRRLKYKIKETFQELEVQTEREIKEFTIGKTFVKARTGVTFNTMKATTWTLDGGINGRWQDYKSEDYDGLVVIGCIERDTIPENVKATNEFFEMNQQTYALGLEQALIQHFILHKPDGRIRNRSFDPGNLSRTVYRGGIVYVAYKLEPEGSYSDDEFREGTGIEKVQIMLLEKRKEMSRLEVLLKGKGLIFQDGMPLEGISFFEACSRQMERVGIPCMDHTELRHMVIQQLRLLSPDNLSSAKFTMKGWNQYLEDLGNGGNIVEDIVLEKMATILDRQIIIYCTEYPDKIGSTSINDQASKKGTPLRLGRHKNDFQCLCRLADAKHVSTQEDGSSTHQTQTVVKNQQKPTKRRKAELGGNAKSIKQPKLCSDQGLVDKNEDTTNDPPVKPANPKKQKSNLKNKGAATSEIGIMPLASTTTQDKTNPIKSTTKQKKSKTILKNKGEAATERANTHSSSKSSQEEQKLIITNDGAEATGLRNIQPSVSTTQKVQKPVIRFGTDQNSSAVNIKMNEPTILSTAATNHDDQCVKVKEEPASEQIPSTALSSTTPSNPEFIDNSDEITSSLTPSTEEIEQAAMAVLKTPTKRPGMKRVQMVKEEMKLILKSYIQQRMKSDFEFLVETVYSQRYQELPGDIARHYETMLPHQRKDRIRRFINDCKSGKRNEKDPEIIDLIAEMIYTC